MRTYPHRPDVAHLTRNARFTYGGIDTLLARVERSGPQVWAKMGRIAMLTGWQAMALAWAEERPIDEVRRYLELSAEWCRQLAAAAAAVDVLDAPGWLWTFVIAGDRTSAGELAARIPGQVQVAIAANAPIAVEVAAVARLVDGHDPRPAIVDLRHRLADPRTDTELAEALSPELAMIEALSAQDPAVTARSFDTLTRRHIDRYGSSAPARRSLDGLLDMTSLMFAALALDRGLAVPVDNPYVPTELLGPR